MEAICHDRPSATVYGLYSEGGWEGEGEGGGHRGGGGLLADIVDSGSIVAGSVHNRITRLYW